MQQPNEVNCLPGAAEGSQGKSVGRTSRVRDKPPVAGQEDTIAPADPVGAEAVPIDL